MLKTRLEKVVFGIVITLIILTILLAGAAAQESKECFKECREAGDSFSQCKEVCKVQQPETHIMMTY